MRSFFRVLGRASFTVWAVALILILGGVALPGFMAGESWGLDEERGDAFTPAPGSAERKAILDALRELVPEWRGEKAVFLVRHMKVSKGWAWVETDPRSADGTQHYETLSCLLQKASDKWEIRACRPCCGECEDDPDCRDEKRYYMKLRSSFPQAPRAIFPTR
ncbi:MAG: hypothetical protein ACUVXD_16280 [Thermodesulfobacteriota bacterium]